MPIVTSADGTIIDYDRVGNGPVVIMVAGATQYRKVDNQTPRIAAHLSDDLTVINYDRRGRGSSGDAGSYAVARELEDIEALIDAAGGRAALYGMSSGAVLAIEAGAALGSKVSTVIAYEPPIDPERPAKNSWAGVREQETFAARGDGRGAMKNFLGIVGMPEPAIEEFAASPQFADFAAVGHTIAYDLRIVAEAAADGFPERWRAAEMPILVVAGDASYPFILPGADAVAAALPNAEQKTLAGEGHDPATNVIAPVIREQVLAAAR